MLIFLHKFYLFFASFTIFPSYQSMQFDCYSFNIVDESQKLSSFNVKFPDFQKYYLSWTHGMCVSDDRSLFNFTKLSTEYDLIFSILKSVQYAFPIIICMCSIAKDIYSPAKRVGFTKQIYYLLNKLFFIHNYFVNIL